MSYSNVRNKLQMLKKVQKFKANRFKPLSEKHSRDWRFRCLARLYIIGNYNTIFTGHTATDRAETMFLQLLRGTTLIGITGFQSTKNYSSMYPKYYNYSNFL